MSWQFSSPMRKIINGTTIYLGLFTASSDVSSSTYIQKIINNTKFYLPLSKNSGTYYSNKFRKILNNESYYPHENKIYCKVSFTRNTYSPTSGVIYYFWKITAIEFESSLPCSSKFYSGSTTLKTISTNTKKITGSPVFQTANQKGSTFPLYFSATYNGKTVSGSFTMGSSSTTTFTIS